MLRMIRGIPEVTHARDVIDARQVAGIMSKFPSNINWSGSRSCKYVAFIMFFVKVVPPYLIE